MGERWGAWRRFWGADCGVAVWLEGGVLGSFSKIESGAEVSLPERVTGEVGVAGDGVWVGGGDEAAGLRELGGREGRGAAGLGRGGAAGAGVAGWGGTG